jgi:chitinase
MIHRLQTLYATVPDRQFYLSAAPQCPIPDPQLKVTINKGMFDYIWVQFYNTASCAAINYAENATGFNYDDWVDVILASSNPNARLFIGLPASEDSAYSGYYLAPDQVEPLVNQYMTLYPGTFGGIMLWEATSSDNNTINNMTYADSMKVILDQAQTATSNISSNVGWGQIDKSSLAWASFNSSSAVCSGQPSLDDFSIERACVALVENG